MKVKICGIRTLAAARAAEAAGADFLGFVFAPGRHYIEPRKAAAICQAVHSCCKVGVFVDEDRQRVNEIAALCGLDFVQLHGHEDEEYAQEMRAAVIKAFRWGDDFSAAAANHYPAQYILLDSFSPGMAGGTGRTFAWQQASAAAAELNKPFLVAGGINVENVREAAKIFQPFGVDVSSSLEIDGKKSLQKIREFMDVVRRD